MQSQHTTTVARDRPTLSPARRSTPPAVRFAPSRRVFRALGVATAVLVAVGGYVHLCLYRHGYRTIPKIGVGFGLQVVTSALVVAVLLVGPRPVARVAHVTERRADALSGLAAAALATGTLAEFALTRAPGGLFNFQERGLRPSPQALIALVAEIGVLVVVGAWLVADQMVRRRIRTSSLPGV